MATKEKKVTAETPVEEAPKKEKKAKKEKEAPAKPAKPAPAKSSEVLLLMQSITSEWMKIAYISLVSGLTMV